MDFILQKIKKEETDIKNQAIKYYSIICLVNDIKLSKREIELLAFTSLNGTISSKNAKQKFCREFGSSVATVNNMVPSLLSVGLLEEIDGEYKVNKKLDLNFHNRDIQLEIKLIKVEKNESRNQEQPNI